MSFFSWFVVWFVKLCIWNENWEFYNGNIPVVPLNYININPKMHGLNYRIQGHLLKSHLITKMPIVLCFVLQKILTHVKQVVQSGPEFCSCSLIKGYAEKYHFRREFSGPLKIPMNHWIFAIIILSTVTPPLEEAQWLMVSVVVSGSSGLSPSWNSFTYHQETL